MDPDFEATLNRLLSDHKVMSLATSGPQGLWVASTYFARQGRELVCLVTHGTKTLANLTENPEAAFAIDSQEPLQHPFLQGHVRASPMPPPRERALGEQMLKEKIPEIAGFMAQPHYDILRLTPTKLFLTDFAQGWFPAKVEEL